MKYRVQVGTGVIYETNNLDEARSVYRHFAILKKYGTRVLLLDISENPN